MGGRQSKRSVDITTTPRKGESEVVIEGEGKLEKIGDADIKATSNGAAHTDIEFADREETLNEPVEAIEKQDAEVKENGLPEIEEPKTPDAESTVGQLNDSALTEKTPESTAGDNKGEETPESKKSKDKNKKKKWSFRSISFSKKDKSKPNKDSDKNGDVKEVAEENVEDAASPVTESPKAEEQKAPQEIEKVTNGDASTEELIKPAEADKPAQETAKPAEEQPKPAAEEPPTKPVVEEIKVPDPVVEQPAESAPSPVKDDVPPVEEPTPKIEEPKPVEPTPVVEETKEVRSEEVPPPLPSSNPPSPVTVFAESTKADALPADQVPLETPQSPVVETIAERPVAEPVVELTPQHKSSPIIENVPEHESATAVEDKGQSVSESSLLSELTKTSEADFQAYQLGISPSLKDAPLPASSITVASSSAQVSLSSSLSGESEIEGRESTKELVSVPSLPQVPDKPEQPGDLPKPLEITSEPIVDPKLTEVPVESPAPPSETPNISDELPWNEEISVQEKSVSTDPLSSEKSTATSTLVLPKNSPTAIPESLRSTICVPTSPAAAPDTISAVESLPDPVVPSPEPSFSLQSESVVSTTPEIIPETEQLADTAFEPVVYADSLLDISTESLPSLPEPVSENLAEPMSLPPVDSVPEPIATDSIPECPVSDIPPPPDSPVLTNGKADGLPSPTDEVSLQAVKQGPSKQVPVKEIEARQEGGDKSSVEKAETVAAEE